MNHLHAVPADPPHRVLSLRREAARLRWNHDHERRRICLLALLLPLATLLCAVTWIAGLYVVLALALTCIALTALL